MKKSIASCIAIFLLTNNIFSAPPVASTSNEQLTGQKAGEEMSVNLGGGVELELVWIPPGEFLMGSPITEQGRQENETQHKVKLTRGFWMGKYEVMQKQWEKVTVNNPSWPSKGPDLPVTCVSWDDCQECIKKMNKTVLASAGFGSADVFRLPTEAEWEYACRAGTTTRFNTGDSQKDMERAGWYDGQGSRVGDIGNSGGKLHPVGQKEKNAWGLYDMHGNVEEWCADSCDGVPLHDELTTDTYRDGVVDPLCMQGGLRVFRGGGWNFSHLGCRSASRCSDVRSHKEGCYSSPYSEEGFRLVVAPRNQQEISSQEAGTSSAGLVKKAEDGASGAQFQMGQIFCNGTNSPAGLFIKDNVEGLYWYLKAAEQNQSKAKHMLETIQSQHLVPEEDLEKARKLTGMKPGSAFLLKNGSVSQTSKQIQEAVVMPFPPFDNGQAKLNAGDILVMHLGGGVRMELAWIPSGEFIMGTPANEKDRGEKEVPHNVTLTKGFWMGKYEVTQEQWQRIMDNNPSDHKGTKLPVERVSWNDCQTFVKKMDEVFAGAWNNNEGGYMFRLPTEAEWEYACRAGTTTRFNTGDTEADLDRAAWCRRNSGGKTHPVGEKQANAWGLYDMHGNVFEWCQDWGGDNPTAEETDPMGTSGRVCQRGGDCDMFEMGCRSARRWWTMQPGQLNDTDCFGGLRVVIVPQKAQPVASASGETSEVAMDKLEKAADAGDSDSQFQMGEVYFKGTSKLIAKDNVEAVYWYLKAAAQNHAKAKQMLETIRTQKLVSAEDIEKARKILQSEGGSTKAGAKKTD
jgi:formylglycine-generating enzyme required for sulfatase activity